MTSKLSVPQNQLDELCKSLQEFGQFKNIVLWQGYCIAGNGLVSAARSLEWKTIKAVIRDELTEEQAKRLCVADNATPYLAQADSQKLEKLLKSLPSIEDIPGATDAWLDYLDINLLDTFSGNSIQDIETVEIFNETCTIKIICKDWQEYEDAVKRLGRRITYVSLKELLR